MVGAEGRGGAWGGLGMRGAEGGERSRLGFLMNYEQGLTDNGF